jgi:hypothetical protein
MDEYIDILKDLISPYVLHRIPNTCDELRDFLNNLTRYGFHTQICEMLSPVTHDNGRVTRSTMELKITYRGVLPENDEDMKKIRYSVLLGAMNDTIAGQLMNPKGKGSEPDTHFDLKTNAPYSKYGESNKLISNVAQYRYLAKLAESLIERGGDSESLMVSIKKKSVEIEKYVDVYLFKPIRKARRLQEKKKEKWVYYKIEERKNEVNSD